MIDQQIDQEGTNPAKKRPSMRRAINNMCKGCIYDPLSGHGTWRQQVQACQIEACPLWVLRPRSSGVERVTDGEQTGTTGSMSLSDPGIEGRRTFSLPENATQGKALNSGNWQD